MQWSTTMSPLGSQSEEILIDTVDVSRLSSGIRWMIMRPFAPRFVEEVELGRYVRGLLATRRWSMVRVVPHQDEQGVPSRHVFDVFGVPATRRLPSELR
jgi:hypothetical protein